MKKLYVIVLIALLSACATVNKVDSGKRAVGDRFVLTIEGAWNHIDFPGIKPAQAWTMEGLAIDELLIYSGIRDGQALHPEFSSDSKKKNFSFRSTMQTEEVVSAFEGMLSRDGSTFKLIKLEPFTLGGKKGFRFEYERIRKRDNVQQNGVGYGAVDKGELFALIYHAPRLTFFPRQFSRVEAIARSAQIN